MFRDLFRKKRKRDVYQSDMKPVTRNTRGLRKEFLERDMVTQAGLEYELLNPDPMLDKKGETLVLYDKLLVDDKIKFTTDIKKGLVLNVPHKIVDASDEEKDVEIGDFCRKNFDDLTNPTFDDIIDNLLDAMSYGHKEGEIVWGVSEGKFVWERVRFQHPILFDFKYNERGDLDKVLYGYNYGNDTEIPAKEFNEKFIYLCWPYLKDGNWYGDSDLREVYFDWWSKFNIKRWRNMYLQGYGMPIPIVTYDHAKCTIKELNLIDDMFDNWQEQMRIKIPADRNPVSGELEGRFKIEFKDGNVTGGTAQYEKAIDSINNSIMWKLLIPSKLGFSEDRSGSFAQTKKIFDVLLMVVGNIHRRLEDSIQPKVKQLVDLNFAGVEEYPRFEFDEIEDKVAREMLQLLLKEGIIDKREKWLRGYVGIPQLTEEEQAEIDESKEEDIKKQQDQFGGGNNDNNNIDNGNGNNGTNNQGNDKGGNRKNRNVVDNKTKVMKFKTVDFKKIKRFYDESETDFVRGYDEIHKEQSDRLVSQVERKKIIEDKDYKALKSLRIVKSDFKKLFSTYYAKMYLTGKVDAITEIEGRLPLGEMNTQKMKGYRKFQVDPELAWLNRSWVDDYLKKYGALGTLTKADKKYLVDLRDKAFFITGETENRMLKETYHIIDNGIRSGATTSATVSLLQETLKADRQKYALTIARTNASDSYNTGRMNLFMSDNIRPFMEAFRYSAVMDNVTTEFCEEHDGQIIKPSDPDFGVINPPNHFNCRSLMESILVGESEIKGDEFYKYEEKMDPWGTDVESKYRLPEKGFGGVTAWSKL